MVNESEIYLGAGNIDRLSGILNYHLSTIALYFLWFFSPALFLAVIAAVLFAPYMLFVLFREKRYGWITFFIVLVLLPVLIDVLFFYHTGAYLILLFLPLAFFYFYCFLLKITIQDWIQERNAINERFNDINEQLNNIINKEL